MKANYKILLGIALTSLGLTGCQTEAPFQPEAEGTVSFDTQMHSDIELSTRGIDAQSKQELEDNLTIYIESNKGVIRKYLGKKNLPNSLTLTAGDYAIEGWTGDSVDASYTQKFYRGYQKFTVEPGANSQVKFNVNIANVVVSVDPETLEQKMDDFKVTFSHSHGLLNFDRKSAEEGQKGYFMMPEGDNDLYYKVELKSQLGEDIVKEGYIKNVERAHEYSLKILTEEPENTLGGGYVKIEILDIPIIDKSLNVYPAPVYYAQLGASTEEFDIVNNQIDFSEGTFSDLRVRIVGYGGLSKLAITFPEPFEGMEAINGVNLRNNNDATTSALAAMKENNISYTAENEGKVFDDSGSTTVQECWLVFSADFFKSLPDSTKEYVIEVNATDAMPISASSSLQIRFANTEAAVDKKLVESSQPSETYSEDNPMAILATSAQVELRIRQDEALNYGIEYRKKAEGGEFTRVEVPANISTFQTVKVTLKDLEPGTEYEYRAYCDGYTEQNLRTFTTEGKYTIPNASMENWVVINSTVTSAKNVPVPSDTNEVTFWDTGNHGSRSVSLMAVTLTENSTTIKNSGSMSAKLGSRFVGVGSSMGKFAAGNLFVGYFAGTDGMDGILQLGRPYNSSHPSALNVYVHYRPGIVANNVADGVHLNAGDKDHAQIYVALTTNPIEIRTKNQSKLFDENDPDVLAYGQITMTDDVGPDNGMTLQNIPLKYKEAAKTTQAKYLVIVCSASKYGDYFVGGEGSVMYLDDFELEYKDVQFN